MARQRSLAIGAALTLAAILASTHGVALSRMDARDQLSARVDCLVEAAYLLDDGRAPLEGLARSALAACAADFRRLDRRGPAGWERRAWAGDPTALAPALAGLAANQARTGRVRGPYDPAAAGSKPDPKQDIEAAPESTRAIETVNADVTCRMSDAALSPDGRYALAWLAYAQPMARGLATGGDAAVVDLDCALAGQGPACKAVMLNRGQGPEPLAWSRDSRSLYLVYRKGAGPRPGLAVGGPGRLERFAIGPRPDAGGAATITREGPVSVSYPPKSALWMGGPVKAESLAEARQALAAGLMRILKARPAGGQLSGAAPLGDGPLALFWDRDDQSMSALAVAGPVTPVPAALPELDEPRLTRTGDGGMVLTALGVWQDVGPRSRPAAAMAGLYSRPVLWAEDGALAGTYAERSVRLRDEGPTSVRLEQALNRVLDQDPRAFIRGLSVSRAGRALLLLSDDDGVAAAHILDVRSGRAARYDCPVLADEPPPGVTILKDPRQAARPATIGRAVSLGTRRRPLYGTLLTSPGGPGRKLVVEFHGGPLDSARRPRSLTSVDHYRAMGFDVLVMEYSGSLGGGLRMSGRLRRSGGAALARDAELVRDFVRRSDYRFRVLHVESFGAAIALAAPRRDAEVYQAQVMLVPAARWLSPQAVNARGDPQQVLPRAQEAFETVAFGPRGARDDVRAWLNRQGRAWRARLPTFAYYAAHDARVSPDDLVRGPGLHVVVEPHATHEMIDEIPTVWTSIQANLEAVQASHGPLT